MAELGISADRVEEMQTVPMERLVAALAGMSRRGGQGAALQFSPFVDGEILPTNPFDPVATPVSATVPILIGTNLTEQAFFALSFDQAAFHLDEAGLRQRAVAFVGEEKAPQLLELYKRRYPGEGPSMLYFLLDTDRTTRLGSITLAERKFQQGKAPVYMYLYAWRTPALGGILGAPHTVEIPFVWNNTDIPKVMTTGSPAEKALAAKTSDAWIQFARTGNPNHKGLPNWPAYTAGDRSTMVFNNECKMVNDPGGEERQFWQSAAQSQGIAGARF
jgi:para-nitrobenzyl esterase